MDHLIPKNRGGRDSSENMVWSCKNCNVSRKDKGIFEWLGLKEKDNLHRIVAGKYLKQLFDMHEEKETIDTKKEDIKTLCLKCNNKLLCIKWNKVEELTCFCLESIF